MLGAYTGRIAWYEAEMTEEMETEAKKISR